jgi:hypothetical protein
MDTFQTIDNETLGRVSGGTFGAPDVLNFLSKLFADIAQLVSQATAGGSSVMGGAPTGASGASGAPKAPSAPGGASGAGSTPKPPASGGSGFSGAPGAPKPAASPMLSV